MSSVRATAVALVVVLAGAATATAGGSSSGRAAAPCVPKTVKVSGHNGVVMCGPATASMTVAGKTYSFSGGTCTQDPASSSALQLSVGTAVLDPKVKPVNAGKSYFSISIAKPATVATAFAYSGGKVVVALSTIKARGSIPASGTFSGKAMGSSAAFSGSWNCHGPVVKLGG